MVMKEVSISEFKAKCLGMIEQVEKTRQPLRITRHGKPAAEVVPAAPDRKPNFLGDMRGTVEILGDLVSPVIDRDEFRPRQRTTTVPRHREVKNP